jgi:hypothetical protein
VLLGGYGEPLKKHAFLFGNSRYLPQVVTLSLRLRGCPSSSGPLIGGP